MLLKKNAIMTRVPKFVSSIYQENYFSVLSFAEEITVKPLMDLLRLSRSVFFLETGKKKYVECNLRDLFRRRIYQVLLNKYIRLINFGLLTKVVAIQVV